jgi:hypothetical protein
MAAKMKNSGGAVIKKSQKKIWGAWFRLLMV